MEAKAGSLLSITRFHTSGLCWNLCGITFPSYLQDDMNNKVIKPNNENKVSRIVKRRVSFEELQDLRRLSDWTVKGDGKFKLNKHEIHEKSILVFYIWWWLCAEHLGMRYRHYKKKTKNPTFGQSKKGHYARDSICPVFPEMQEQQCKISQGSRSAKWAPYTGQVCCDISLGSSSHIPF